jgi:hypothetical protein
MTYMSAPARRAGLFIGIGEIGLVLGFAFVGGLFAIYVTKGQRQQF